MKGLVQEIGCRLNVFDAEANEMSISYCLDSGLDSETLDPWQAETGTSTSLCGLPTVGSTRRMPTMGSPCLDALLQHRAGDAW